MKRLECPPLKVDRINHIYGTIDEWMRSSALADLVKSFDSQIPINLNTVDLGTWLLGFSERWDFRKSQQEATAKDTGEGSRWLVNDSSLTEAQSKIIKQSAKELGLIGVEKPSKDSYNFILVLGGARLSCLLRPKLAATLIREHAIQVNKVVLLASSRPVALTERDATDTYAPNAITEFDLINKGAEKVFKIKMSFTEQRNEDAINANKSWIIHTYAKTENLPSIISMCAPSSEPDVRRANSVDTYEFFFHHNNVPAGSSLLLITSQIYVPYQQLEAIRTVALKHNVIVETIGFPQEWAGSLQGMTILSNYLQEIRSTIQSANRFFTAYPKQ